MEFPPGHGPSELTEHAEPEVHVHAEIVEPTPWGFWATIGWTLLGGLLMLITQIVVVIPFLAVHLATGSDANVEEFGNQLATNGLVLSVATLVSALVCWGYLTVICRLRGWQARDYLALERLRLRPTLVCLGILAAFIVVSDGTTYLLGRDIVPEFMTAVYGSAKWPPLLILALVVGAPVGEELMFRGFLFRGLANSIGVVAAIVVTSLAWAVMHLQYDVYGIGVIFLGGIMLGTIRHVTGSTTLPMVLHGVMNAVATIEVVLYIHLFE